MEWYKIRQIDEVTYVISEVHHWEETNIYYLIGEKFNLVIDTGTGLYKLIHLLKQIDNKEIYVITTHAHWDHIGNHDEFKHIIIHELDKDWITKGVPIPIKFIRMNLIKDVPKELIPENFVLEDYHLFTTDTVKTVSDREIIDLGGREIEILHTPGHSPGHICLYEPNRGYLYTGDILYRGRMYCNYESTDPKAYYESAKKLYKLKGNITKILAGHHEPILGAEYLTKLIEIMEETHSRNLLCHGSGVHSKEDIEVIF